MKTVSVFGSTGSIGKSTIEVIKAHQSTHKICVLTAHANYKLLAEQSIALNAEYAVIADDTYYQDLKSILSGTSIKILAGQDGLLEAAHIPTDWSMASIMGMAGLNPLLAMINRGGIIAIANKEPLVAAADILLQAAKKSGATILPVDSEHNAIFQVFESHNKSSIEKILLTASGGPFLRTPIKDLSSVTPAQALAHPNWVMGRKISIDSATMMNKALEVIEAYKLFDIPAEKIEVLVHPQSIIHSMIEYCDGSVLAQLGASDMSTPITYSLGYPYRLTTPGQRIDFHKIKSLEFEPLDKEKFPSVSLAYDCLSDGIQACIALNAANEIAVQAFLDQKIAFLDIYKIVDLVVAQKPADQVRCLDDVIAYDKIVRQIAESSIVQLANNLYHTV